ncbi:hypothetical protein EDB86DRAFT_3242138 [Lactarius hatsudake]|nr:hypothetical protein EDB86DRAFT_3242138 [Lactarius hatsudake]
MGCAAKPTPVCHYDLFVRRPRPTGQPNGPEEPLHWGCGRAVQSPSLLLLPSMRRAGGGGGMPPVVTQVIVVGWCTGPVIISAACSRGLRWQVVPLLLLLSSLHQGHAQQVTMPVITVEGVAGTWMPRRQRNVSCHSTRRHRHAEHGGIVRNFLMKTTNANCDNRIEEGPKGPPNF